MAKRRPNGDGLVRKEKTADGKDASWQVIKRMATRYTVRYLPRSRVS